MPPHWWRPAQPPGNPGGNPEENPGTDRNEKRVAYWHNADKSQWYEIVTTEEDLAKKDQRAKWLVDEDKLIYVPEDGPATST